MNHKSVSKVSSVLVGCFGQEVWVRVEGRGSFQNSAGLKEFSQQMIQKGFRKFVVDLKKCELMDSTFVGTLAGVVLRLVKIIGQGNMQVINVNERNMDLLKNLGLDHLFEIQSPENSSHISPPLKVKRLKETKPIEPDVLYDAIYSAHKALIEAHAENEPLFKDVLEYLQEEKAKQFPNHP